MLCCALAVKGGRAARRRAAELGGHPGGAVHDAGLRLGRSQARRLALSTGEGERRTSGRELLGQGVGRGRGRREEEPGRPGRPPKKEVALVVASHRRKPSALPCALAVGPRNSPRGCGPDLKDLGDSGRAPPPGPSGEPSQPEDGDNEAKEAQAHLVPRFLLELLGDFCV